MNEVKEVRIGKTVPYKTLETALVKAAKEIGWKIKIKDEFEKKYELGSVKEVFDYLRTEVHLRGRVFPAMELSIYKKPSNYFFALTNRGFASDKKVKEYLNAVSRNLK